MKLNQYSLKSKVWVFDGPAPWFFVSVVGSVAKHINSNFGDLKGGWGSLPVDVTIGKTSWTTSIFTDKKIGGFLLPLKKEVRKKENIKAGDTVKVNFAIKI